MRPSRLAPTLLALLVLLGCASTGCEPAIGSLRTGASVGEEENLFVSLLKDLSTGGVGAFLGAWFAFKLENRRREREDRKENLSAAKRAQFTLTRQYTQLKHLDEMMKPLEVNPERWKRLDPVIGMSHQNRLNLPSLHFLLDSKTPALLDKLAFCDDRYGQALDVLAMRNQAVLELRAKLETLRSSPTPPLDHATIDASIGFDLKGRLNDLTDGLYTSVRSAISLNEGLFAQLSGYIESTFPGERPMSRGYIQIFQGEEGKTANDGPASSEAGA